MHPIDLGPSVSSMALDTGAVGVGAARAGGERGLVGGAGSGETVDLRSCTVSRLRRL